MARSRHLVLTGFLQRLIRDAGRKVFLILDRLPVHRAAAVPWRQSLATLAGFSTLGRRPA